MTVRDRVSLVFAVLLLVLVAPLRSGAQPAPAFSVVDTTGALHTNATHAGRFVVLEWHNRGCPYVKKHYRGNMQTLQKTWTSQGVVWLTVLSSGPGEQGHLTAAEADGFMKDHGGAPTAILLDGTGAMGRAFEARTTPQMVVLGPKGDIIYSGAIDSRPTADVADLATAKNYVAAALSEAMAGKPVTTPFTKPYGCGIKYAPAVP